MCFCVWIHWWEGRAICEQWKYMCKKLRHDFSSVWKDLYLVKDVKTCEKGLKLNFLGWSGGMGWRWRIYILGCDENSLFDWLCASSFLFSCSRLLTMLHIAWSLCSVVSSLHWCCSLFRVGWDGILCSHEQPVLGYFLAGWQDLSVSNGFILKNRYAIKQMSFSLASTTVGVPHEEARCCMAGNVSECTFFVYMWSGSILSWTVE